MDLPLPVLLFGITFVVELLGWIGNERLVAFFHPATTFFSTTPTATATRALKKDILAVRAELAATSSQNEFAKWAKLRRKLDKGAAELEAIQAQSAGARARFATYFKGSLWVLTTVLPFIVSSWHRKEAVFYLPTNWLGPVGWFLALPGAPTGAVACGVWTMACKRTLGVVKDIVVDNLAPSSLPPPPMAVPTGTEEVQNEKSSRKDEL